MPRVSINIVTWNSLKFLPEALKSIAAQTYRDFSVLIIDNASSDGTTEFIRSEYPSFGLLRNFKNLGFCRAHNQGIGHVVAHSNGGGEDRLILVTNPDIVLEPDFLKNLVASLDRRLDAGSAGGKLLKIFDRDEGGMREPVRTATIDSTGLRVLRSRRFVDRGAGESDDGRYDRPEEVFGVSGAVALYRLAALEDVAQDGQYFDEDFFAYKEDVDLAWRLRLRGWTSLYAPAARAYHYRTAAGGERARLREIASGRLGRSKFVNYLSYRNHLFVLAKNEFAANYFRHWIFIKWYESVKFLYILFLEPSSLRALPEILRQLPRFLRKRRENLARAKVSAKDMRRWFASR
ncbi:MAG: glycosyltransferase family 2 protein [Patescibacteria group bacterium]|jgi:GT2 family glycosyltransferase